MIEKATFSMGCFWQPDEIYSKVNGVKGVVVGYTGGEVENPTYEKVCGGSTGHAEALEIEFDSDVVTYEDLLKIFWENHDPTQLDKQGPDVGSQYRSSIFYHNEKQKELAEKTMHEFEPKADGSIVTEIVPANEFYPAEDYHQKYLEKQDLIH